ncbi:MAG: hypothetical protein HY362_01560 [Candidatus Aenigmarchaeota archaeon]|nr:hypothetical protein [Candidatus Aenigmarchaeota archaeon]
MKYVVFALAIVVLAAGCTGQAFPNFGNFTSNDAKNLQEIQKFMADHPNAEIKTSVYDSDSIKAVLPEFKDDCPTLGKEDKTYSKITARDPDTNRGMIVWVDDMNKVICSVSKPIIIVQTTTTAPIKKSDGSACEIHDECVSGLCLNKVCSTPGSVLQTTTSIASTTTTTVPPTTTTSNDTNAAVTSSTTTTLGPMPDLFVSDITITKPVYYLDTWNSNQFSHNISFRVTNIGSAQSNATLARIKILNESAGNVTITTNLSSVKSLAPGESVLVDFNGPYKLTRSTRAQAMYYLSAAVDLSDQFSFYNNTESSETNNEKTVSFPVPYIFPTQANFVINYISILYGNVTYQVKNIGSETSGAFSISINMYNSLNQSAGGCGGSGPALAPGMKTNLTWCWVSGAAKANATVDAYNMTIETNENDNVNSTFA